MLVLTRREGENIVINDNIVITVLENEGKKIRIGINAPKSVEIHRQEVYDRIQAKREYSEEQI